MLHLSEDILKTLQEEFHEALSLTEKSQYRPYEFPNVKNIIHGKFYLIVMKTF
jgi:hypothetical protein